MTEDTKKRVGVEGSSNVDWLSILPESLLCKILMNRPTKDVVKSSVLSKRWRNLWRYLPALDLDDEDFPLHKTFASFVDAFLDFNRESHLESFKLKYYGYCDYGIPPEIGLLCRWINTVVDRRVKHLHLWHVSGGFEEIQMPPNLFTCESLVSLKLNDVDLGRPKFVSLPSLKVMDLTMNHFDNDLDLEKLISHCPVLESLFIKRSLSDDFLDVLRGTEALVVAIDAPRLQYLRLGDNGIASFILNNTSSLIEVDIDVVFNCWSFRNKFENDLQKRKMIRSFLEGISCVKDITITSETLEVFYYYSRCEHLPLFHSLSFLRVRFANYRWEMLQIFLESCPNLKSLVVASSKYPEKGGIRVLPGPRCLLSSLEYVDIERPLKGEAMEMKLLSYFLENSAILKKLSASMLPWRHRKKLQSSKNSLPFQDSLAHAKLFSDPHCHRLLRYKS